LQKDFQKKKDGKVDKKDLKIAELEKDLRIKQLEKEIEETDDPAPEAKMKEASRLRIKDRGNSFECIDEKGNCVKKFPYDNKETFAKGARYDAQRFAEKHYAKQLGEELELDEAKKYSWNDVNDAILKANSMTGRPPEVIRISKKFPHKSRKDKIFTLNDVKKRLSATGIDAKKQYDIIKNMNEEVELEEGRKWRVSIGKETYVVDARNTDEAHKKAAKIAKREGNRGSPGLAVKISEGENDQVDGGDPCWPGYEMVGMKNKNGKQVPNCVPVKEETALQERRKFIFAAMQAKKEGKKKFLFQGKEYPVTIKEDVLEEGVDKKILDMLKDLDTDEARMIIQGMPKKDQRAYMKKLGMKETVDGRTKGYRETAQRLMKKKVAIILI